MSRWIAAAILSAWCMATVTPARADAIDGHWCQKDGRRMSIEGSKLVTPGGTSMLGDYSRHAFVYTVPAGEAHAGARIQMELVHEDLIRLRIPGPEGSPPATEDWQRCELTM
ncbi:MAG: hypothetical protein VX871_00195 [Pseudomonadota bacterium]|nr:hypothetical protein [Pseudomonadota bacterium]